MTRVRTLVLIFCALYLSTTLYRAEVKPLWYDELFTYHVAGEAALAKIWTALRACLDPNPPMIYAAMYISQSLLGDGHIGTRLPSILGFLLLLLSVYRFVSFRLPAPYALQAMVFVALSGAYSFAYEARAYALLLGFSGLALSCWQRREIPGLAASLAAALLTHCYSILLFPPLFAGELVRTWRNRRIDWPVWIALAAPCSIVISYVGLSRSTEVVTLKGPIFDPTVFRLIASYLDLLVPALWPAAVTLVLIAALTRFAARRFDPAFPAQEWTALGLLALAPAMAFTVSQIVRGGYFTRYGLGVCIPIGVAVAWLSFSLAGRDWQGARYLPLLAMTWFAGAFVWQARQPAVRIPSAELQAWLDQGTQPLVILDGQTFLELDHYLDPASASRLVFLTDYDSALRYMHTDCYDTALRIVAPWFGLRGKLIPFKDFLARREPFLAYGTRQPDHYWLLPRLHDEAVPYQVRTLTDRKQLLLVDRP